MTQSHQETLRSLLSEPPFLIAVMILLWRRCHGATGFVPSNVARIR